MELKNIVFNFLLSLSFLSYTGDSSRNSAFNTSGLPSNAYNSAISSSSAGSAGPSNSNLFRGFLRSNVRQSNYSSIEDAIQNCAIEDLEAFKDSVNPELTRLRGLVIASDVTISKNLYPIFLAIDQVNEKNCSDKIIEKLIELDANLNPIVIISNDLETKGTPLSYAIDKKLYNIANLLLSSGAKFTNNDLEFWAALKTNEPKYLSLLLKHGLVMPTSFNSFEYVHFLDNKQQEEVLPVILLADYAKIIQDYLTKLINGNINFLSSESKFLKDVIFNSSLSSWEIYNILSLTFKKLETESLNEFQYSAARRILLTCASKIALEFLAEYKAKTMEMGVGNSNRLYLPEELAYPLLLQNFFERYPLLKTFLNKMVKLKDGSEIKFEDLVDKEISRLILKLGTKN